MDLFYWKILKLTRTHQGSYKAQNFSLGAKKKKIKTLYGHDYFLGANSSFMIL